MLACGVACTAGCVCVVWWCAVLRAVCCVLRAVCCGVCGEQTCSSSKLTRSISACGARRAGTFQRNPAVAQNDECEERQQCCYQHHHRRRHQQHRSHRTEACRAQHDAIANSRSTQVESTHPRDEIPDVVVQQHKHGMVVAAGGNDALQLLPVRRERAELLQVQLHTPAPQSEVIRGHHVR